MQTSAFRIEESAASRTATLRLIRPEDGNRLNLEDISLVGRAIRELGTRHETKLVIIRTEGPDFCLGRAPDLQGSAKSALEIRDHVAQPILDVYAEIRAVPVPVLAVVQGRASGFGCALVAQCDLAITADDAVFSLPEMDHHLPPTLAMSAMLHKVAPKRLMHMVYTREPITATEALSLGIISRVASRAQLDVAIEETAGKFTGRNRTAICAIKEYASGGPLWRHEWRSPPGC